MTESPRDLLPTHERFFGWDLENPNRMSVADFAPLDKPPPLKELGDAAATVCAAHGELNFAARYDGVWREFDRGAADPNSGAGRQQPPVRLLDLRDLTDASTVVGQLCTTLLETHNGFSLERGDLFSVDLVLLPNCSPLIHVAAHHLGADLASTRLLCRQLVRLLDRGAAPRPSQLGDLRRAVTCYRADPAFIDHEQSYWRSQFSGLDGGADAMARPRLRSSSAPRYVHLGLERSRTLHTWCSTSRTPPAVALAAVSMRAYLRTAGASTFAVDLVESGRNLDGFGTRLSNHLRTAVGWLATTSTIPVAGALHEALSAHRMPDAVRTLAEYLAARPSGPLGPLLLKVEAQQTSADRNVRFVPPSASLYVNYMGTSYEDAWPHLRSVADAADVSLEEVVEGLYGSMRRGRAEPYALKVFVTETTRGLRLKLEERPGDIDVAQFEHEVTELIDEGRFDA